MIYERYSTFEETGTAIRSFELPRPTLRHRSQCPILPGRRCRSRIFLGAPDYSSFQGRLEQQAHRASHNFDFVSRITNIGNFESHSPQSPRRRNCQNLSNRYSQAPLRVRLYPGRQGFRVQRNCSMPYIHCDSVPPQQARGLGSKQAVISVVVRHLSVDVSFQRVESAILKIP